MYFSFVFEMCVVFFLFFFYLFCFLLLTFCVLIFTWYFFTFGHRFYSSALCPLYNLFAYMCEPITYKIYCCSIQNATHSNRFCYKLKIFHIYFACTQFFLIETLWLNYFFALVSIREIWNFSLPALAICILFIYFFLCKYCYFNSTRIQKTIFSRVKFEISWFYRSVFSLFLYIVYPCIELNIFEYF